TGWRSESWRFATLEVRIISSKQLTFQSVRFKENIPRNALSFNRQILPQAVYRAYDTSMNQWLVAGNLYVPSRSEHKAVEFLHWVFSLVRQCEIKGYSGF